MSLKTDHGNQIVRLYLVRSPKRPDGYRYSKYVATVQSESEGATAQGSGESQNSMAEAIEKGISEAIERLMLSLWCKSNKKSLTSNGWAAHPELLKAKYSASRELLERDSVLTHWYKKIPFLEIDFQTIPIKYKIWHLLQLRRAEFPILKVYLTAEGYYPSVVVALLNKQGNGILGTASGACLDDAISSALAEACRSAHHFIRGTFNTEISTFQNESKVKSQPGEHSLRYADRQALPNWMILSSRKTNYKNACTQFCQKNLENAILEAKIEFEFFCEGERHVVRAKSEYVQGVHWESTLNQISNLKINFERLGIEKDQINLNPHFVG